MLTTFDEGFFAAQKDRSTTWCPYDEGDPRRDQWLRGWQVGVVTKRRNAQTPNEPSPQQVP